MTRFLAPNLMTRPAIRLCLRCYRSFATTKAGARGWCPECRKAHPPLTIKTARS